MTADRPAPADVAVLALDVLTAAVAAETWADATFDARAALAGLDEDGLRRVAAAVAVTGARALPREVGRGVSVTQALDRLRIEWAWQA